MARSDEWAPNAPILRSLDYERSQVVVPAPGEGPGNWAGAPSAVAADGAVWLAYRVRRPLDAGRGVGVVVARSEDGLAFEPVLTVTRDDFGCASLERPALVRRPDGGWRLYVSCAERGSKNWWIDALDADTVPGLANARPVTVLPGVGGTAVKDPVVRVDERGWSMWVCCHPLDVPGDEDRMTTRLASSADGLVWHLGPTVLAPRPGTWDARGTRLTSVLPTTGPVRVALYDGRATSAENWCERTGVAYAGPDGRFRAPDGLGPVGTSAYGGNAFRYVSVIGTRHGDLVAYFEASRPDGAHDLRTVVLRRRDDRSRASRSRADVGAVPVRARALSGAVRESSAAR